ncbi:AAA family ATPase [Candidatus Riflebacteria bacterium]
MTEEKDPEPEQVKQGFDIKELFMPAQIEKKELDSLFKEVLNTTPRESLAKIYRVLNRHINSPLLDIYFEGKRFNSSLLLSMLTCLINGKAVLFGPSGMGKSTLIESVTQILFGDRLTDIQTATIKCHQNLVIENLEKSFNQDSDFSHPEEDEARNEPERKSLHHSSILFIEDLASLSPPMQTIFSTFLEEGILVSNNVRYHITAKPTFATSNFLDMRNNLSLALHDRFHVSVVPTGLNPSWLNRLFNAPIIKSLNKYSLNLTVDDLESIQEKIEKVAIDQQVLHKIEYFFSEITHCTMLSKNIFFKNRANGFFDRLRDPSRLCRQCRLCKDNKNIICKHIKGNVSTRALESLVRYSKAFAWLCGETSINSDRLIEAIIPYTLLHRIEPSRTAREQDSNTLTRVPWIRKLWQKSMENFETLEESFVDFNSSITQLMDDELSAKEKSKIVQTAAKNLLKLGTPARYNYLTLLLNRAFELDIEVFPENNFDFPSSK